MPELRVVETPGDFSPSENFNYVAHNCSGKWVKFLCHDDLLLPNAIDILEAATGIATEKTALIGNGEVHLFKSGYQSEPEIPFDSPPHMKEYNGLEYLEMVVGGRAEVPNISTACVNREMFGAVKGFDPRWLHMDTFLWHKMLLNYDYIRITNALNVNRIHGGQITVFVRKANRSMKEHREYWREFAGEWERRKKLSWKTKAKLRSKWLLVAGYDAAIFWRKGDHKSASRVLGSAGIFLPVAVLTFLRALGKERKRVKELESHVPIDQIYS
jgi:glycosyltransferase involved in cell wall biosynthesis